MNPIRRLAKRMNNWWSGDYGLWTSLSGSPHTVAGVAVTAETALTLTAVYSAISVISTDTASLPIGVYQRRPDGGRDEARSHPAYELLNVSPDGETTAMRWRQALMGHVLGWGNGTSEIVFDRGYPSALHLLPAQTHARRNIDDKALYYQLPDGTRLPPYRVLHIAGLGYDGLRGYSPIALARQAIGLGLAAETFGAALFGNGAVPKGYLKHPKKLSPAGVANLRESINEVHRGPYNAHKFLLLEEGVEWANTQINPDDAQFLETRAFQILEIARLYRVPPHKIGDYSQAHLANLEESNLDYMMTTLMPWCEQIEQVLNWKLFTPAERAKGLFVEHNMAALMRGNMVARAEFYTKLRDLGVLTPNMIARFENLNPIGPEGDIRLVPLNLTSLANAGKLFGRFADPAKGTDAKAPAAADPALPADGTDVASTALNGAQIASLLEIVNEVATSQIPIETAKAMVKASFPTLSDAEIDGIFAPLESFKPEVTDDAAA